MPLTQTIVSLVDCVQLQRIVIAGGPGSGKSTLLQALAGKSSVADRLRQVRQHLDTHQHERDHG